MHITSNSGHPAWLGRTSEAMALQQQPLGGRWCRAACRVLWHTEPDLILAAQARHRMVKQAGNCALGARGDTQLGSCRSGGWPTWAAWQASILKLSLHARWPEHAGVLHMCRRPLASPETAPLNASCPLVWPVCLSSACLRWQCMRPGRSWAVPAQAGAGLCAYRPWPAAVQRQSLRLSGTHAGDQRAGTAAWTAVPAATRINCRRAPAEFTSAVPGASVGALKTL